MLLSGVNETISIKCLAQDLKACKGALEVCINNCYFRLLVWVGKTRTIMQIQKWKLWLYVRIINYSALVPNTFSNHKQELRVHWNNVERPYIPKRTYKNVHLDRGIQDESRTVCLKSWRVLLFCCIGNHWKLIRIKMKVNYFCFGQSKWLAVLCKFKRDYWQCICKHLGGSM